VQKLLSPHTIATPAVHYARISHLVYKGASI
jgi:hypothetical protein